jgi:hypothetical protein
MARPVGVAVSIASMSEWNFTHDWIGTKANRQGPEIVEHRNQVAPATAQPVQLPHNQRVAVFQLLQAPAKSRALRGDSRYSFTLENGLASGLLQCS